MRPRCANCSRVIPGDLIMSDWPVQLCDRCAAELEDDASFTFDDLPNDVGVDEWLKRKEQE
jgi:hypothetical protein